MAKKTKIPPNKKASVSAKKAKNKLDASGDPTGLAGLGKSLSDILFNKGLYQPMDSMGVTSLVKRQKPSSGKEMVKKVLDNSPKDAKD